MKLRSDWEKVARKAWSMRLMLLAGLLTGAETVLPYFADDLPRGLFSLVSVAVIASAMVARLVVQKDFE